VRLTTSTGNLQCLMCSRPIESGEIAVELIHTAIAHLRCFFGTTNGGVRSLGAAAARRSVGERSRLLRAQSDALIEHSHQLFDRLAARHLLN
jgi:hypothetical protein